MANALFKGFKLVTTGFTSFENGCVYFVRTDADREDGYVYFNGKKYGTAKDVETELLNLIGELPSGYTTVVDYIADIQEASIEGLADLDATVSGESNGSG